MNTESQNSRILRWLESGRRITPLVALERFRCMRLAGRIYELRGHGYPIEQKMVPTPSGKHVAEYRISD